MTTSRKAEPTALMLVASLILLIIVIVAFGFWAYIALVGLTTVFGVSMLGAIGIYISYLVLLFIIKVLYTAAVS